MSEERFCYALTIALTMFLCFLTMFFLHQLLFLCFSFFLEGCNELNFHFFSIWSLELGITKKKMDLGPEVLEKLAEKLELDNI